MKRPGENPKEIVQAGYDHIAESYRAWIGSARGEERARYTDILLSELPAGADLLDLGCGAGEPTTLLLAERFR